MGLRKLTQWEETVAKQEQKQSRLMSVAIVCVIAMCAVLWLVQDKLYGDVVQTGTATYLGAFTGAGIGRALRSIKEKESAEKQKRNGKILVWILFLLVIGGARPPASAGTPSADAFLRDSCPLVFQNTESGLR